MTPVFFVASVFLAGLAGLLFAGFLILTASTHRVRRPLGLALGLTGLIQLANALTLVFPEQVLFWRGLGLLGELIQPAGLLYVSLVLGEMIGAKSDPVVRHRAYAVGLVAALLGTLVWSDLTIRHQADVIALGPLGRVDYIFVLFAMALALAQFEQILRVSREPFRYQIKFLVIGVGALGGYRIYEASRLLLLPIWDTDHAVIEGLVTLLSLALLAYGLTRVRFDQPRGTVYITPQVVYGSVTFLVIGLYLFAVGLVGELIRYTGQSVASVFSTLVVFVAIVGLVVAVSSRAVRTQVKQAIGRHVYRVKYDYRAKWLEVTEAFRTCASVEAILDRFLDVLSGTFGAGRISIWMHFEADNRFHQVRSVNTEAPPPPLSLSHPVISRLLQAQEPLSTEELAQTKQQCEAGDLFWERTRASLCVPLRVEERVLAFVTLSPERGGAYGSQDVDLLRAIAHHVAMLLSLANLAEERRAASELEALHRFSAFCLHDIKNLAARLSLVAQNAEVFGHDPAFQQSAMRTVAGTVQKMMTLITKLSSQSGMPQSRDHGHWETVELQAVLNETMEAMNGGLRARIHRQGDALPPIRMKRDQIQQVLLNVILNAQQACGERGEITITTTREEEQVVVTIADNGPGIPAAVLRTIFNPFRTTKKEGLGVGLYECKRIMEAHHGTMSIESEPGQGTRVRITLPFAAEATTLSGTR